MEKTSTAPDHGSDEATTSALAAASGTDSQTREAGDRVAVVVVHGMGQPVPFQALDPIARHLREAEEQTRRVRPALTSRIVRLGSGHLSGSAPDGLIGEKLARVELTLTDTDGRPREVHLYEAYWAPLTEGKVHFWDVVGFFFDAGLRGIAASFERDGFRRWMFEGWQSFRLDRWRNTFQFLYAYAVVVSLVFTNLLTVAVALARPLLGPSINWPSDALLADLTVDLWLFVLCAVLGGGATLLPHRLHDLATRLEGPTANRPRARYHLNAAFQSVCWVLLHAALIGTVGVFILMLMHLFSHQAGGTTPSWNPFLVALVPKVASLVPDWLKVAGTGLIWLVAFTISWAVRQVLVQYLGDVAAYVSAHTLNKFFKVRTRIKEVAFRTTQAVYAERSGAGPAREYRQVVIVGHSLGSLVAYDTLNALINEDLINRAPHSQLQVLDRTSLFLTSGSPLDKTAFVFRTQRSGVEVRERMAAAVQPMIGSYDYRPARWVNIFSRHDWISGSLEFYDQADGGGGSKRICNLEDPEASSPLMAHDEYWHNRLFIETLYHGVTAPFTEVTPSITPIS